MLRSNKKLISLRNEQFVQQTFSGLHKIGLKSFSHDITFENARASVLSSDASCSQFYLEQGLPYIYTNNQGRFLSPGIYLNNKLAEDSSDFREIFKKLSAKFGFNYSIHILEHEADCQHLYSFNLFKFNDNHTVNGMDFDINQISLILNALRKYKREGQGLIEESKKPRHRFQFSISEEEKSVIKLHKFHQKTYQENLSARQKECLHYLAKGMKTKQIARILDLSSRTVEHYLEAVKDKLNCHSHSALIEYCLNN
jgi:DNA-binding CsgD family transcriptional regulator